MRPYDGCVRSVLQSVQAWAIEVASAWFAWAIAVLTGLVDAAKTIVPSFDVPRSVLIGGYAAAFLIANVRAFHKMRIKAMAASTGTPAEPVAVTQSPPPDDALFAAHRRAGLAQLGLVNQLVGRFQISQFAAPLEHDQKGGVTRVVIAADCLPAKGELRSDTKRVLREALSRSSLERWVLDRVSQDQADPHPDWVLASPSSGQIATLKRDWGISTSGGSRLLGKATLQLPPGIMIGSRVVLVLDVVERPVDEDNEHLRLRLTLAELHELLHILATTAVDELSSAVFPLVCEEPSPPILGPNYELRFGDRSLTTTVQIPSGFTRPSTAQDMPWANISTPEGADARDLPSRDAVLRHGIESMLRQNEYDGIEAEIAQLSMPASSVSR